MPDGSCRRLSAVAEALHRAEAALEELAGVRVADEARTVLRAIRRRLERRRDTACALPVPAGLDRLGEGFVPSRPP